MTSSGLVDLADVQEAARRISSGAVRTPLVRAFGLSERLGADVRLKCECFQRTGSFKIRGAYNTLAQLDPESIRDGVVAYSSGNHGQGVACAARLLATRAIIVTPLTVAHIKEEGIRRYGGTVVKEGYTSVERRKRAETIASEKSLPVVPGFDHPHTIAGQGTMALEILEDWADVDIVLVPIGGGGLISGIALAIKALQPETRVIGVEPAAAPSMHSALAAGSPVTVPRPRTIADGLAAVRVSDLTLAHVSAYVDDVLLVDENQLRHAARLLLLEEKIVAEYSGAATVAALLAGGIDISGRRVAVVVSGGNLDAGEIENLASGRSKVSREAP